MRLDFGFKSVYVILGGEIAPALRRRSLSKQQKRGDTTEGGELSNHAQSVAGKRHLYL